VGSTFAGAGIAGKSMSDRAGLVETAVGQSVFTGDALPVEDPRGLLPLGGSFPRLVESKPGKVRSGLESD
jgi:hypothetical protein